jgi:peptidoglycan/LPS O-acetylase OafA/YrhL
VRNRYLDLLRAAAIVRVVVYHLFGWPWLSIVFPAMGVMFALAGSLTAASLDNRSARNVVTSRLRRLLPPLWLLGLIAVPVMLALGWAHETDGEQPFSPAKLLLWIVPVGDPTGSDKAVDLWEPLWYIRAYLWFVLLSPVMYLAYKKLRWFAVVLPLLAMAALDKTGFTLPDMADSAMWDFVTFGACWMAGFAHHDGRLARVKPSLVVVTAVVLGAVAMYWLQGHPGEDGYDLNDVAESQALWSLAFVLVVLRWQPPMGWLAKVRPLDGAVTLLNGRAVTIYLWHNIAIDAVWPVLAFVALDDLGSLEGAAELVVALGLTALAVLAFGWVEDLAARRRPRLFPARSRPAAAGGPSTSEAATTAQLPQPGRAGPLSDRTFRPADDWDEDAAGHRAEFGLPAAGLTLRPPGGTGEVFHPGERLTGGQHATPDVPVIQGRYTLPDNPIQHADGPAHRQGAAPGEPFQHDSGPAYRQGAAPVTFSQHDGRPVHQPGVAPAEPFQNDAGPTHRQGAGPGETIQHDGGPAFRQVAPGDPVEPDRTGHLTQWASRGQDVAPVQRDGHPIRSAAPGWNGVPEDSPERGRDGEPPAGRSSAPVPWF